MGLDITAYSGLQLEAEFNGEDYEDTYKTRIYKNPDFPGRAEDMPVNDGIYTYAKIMQFPAGSYSGYNEWRDNLARLAGYESARSCWEKHTSGLLFELINFSDCEGVIGPSVSAKLAHDFAELQGKVDQIGGDAPDLIWFKQVYAKFRRAFEMAAENGAVQFH